MKIKLFAIIFFCGFFSTINIAYSQNENIIKKRYNIESAFIKYNIYGNTKGEEILKFDNYGSREIIRINTTREVVFYSVKNIQKIKTLTILNDSILYAIDLKNKTGVKTISRKYNNSNQFSIEEILKNDGKYIKNEVVLKKNCEVWQTKNLKIWLWNGIALKIVSKTAGKNYTKEAIELNENVSINQEELTIPPEINIIDYTN